jgi:phospholipid/cholesterol/gamma-HCH transport system substrate-binding protein
VATTSPPSQPPAAPPPRPGPGAPIGRPRAFRPGITRALAIAALAAVVVVLALLVFGGNGGASYHLMFADAGQLVKGDQVQVGGVPVGIVTDIQLTKDYKARVTIHVNGSLTPLHEGTVAQVRVPSLFTVANRYIALSPGPNNKPALAGGATLPASATREVVDLDQLFNTLDPKTRKGLAEFIQGTAEQYAGAGRALGRSTEYFAPALTSTNHFFSELVRDQPVFTSFLVESAKAVTTIAGRKEQLADLIENANSTFRAIGSQQSQLAKGLRLLPVTLRQGNRTFAELPSTFSALKQLVDTSKPTTKSTIKLFERLRPLVNTATPAVANFANAFNRPGAKNDLTDLVRALPELARALTTSSPSSVTALQESVPITAFFGPYSPDLSGTLRTFGQAGAYYDADGHYARLAPVFPSFTLGENNTLKPAASPQQALAGLKSGQLRRCPGGATQAAADGSSPFVDNGLLSCDPSETP